MKIISTCTEGVPYCSSSRKGASVRYIVLHYTGVAGAKGADMAKRFARKTLPPLARKSSAHYVVDGDTVWQAVPDRLAAWHVGNGQPDERYACYGGYAEAQVWHDGLYPDTFKGNRESIGIELCCIHTDPTERGSVTDRSWAFTEGTTTTAAELCIELCRKYGIPPEHVLRHYDATGKPCTRPFVSLPSDRNEDNDRAWGAFKDIIEKALREDKSCD